MLRGEWVNEFPAEVLGLNVAMVVWSRVAMVVWYQVAGAATYRVTTRSRALHPTTLC